MARPDEITAGPLAALADYKQIYTNVSGELGQGTFLRQHGVARKDAEAAAAGWGGDRMTVHAPPGDEGKVAGTVAVAYSVWDDEADAIEYFDAVVAALPSLAAGGARVEVEAEAKTVATWRNPDGELMTVERRADAVVLVVGAPAASADAIRDQAFKSWTVKRR